jgi:hypothetical protein
MEEARVREGWQERAEALCKPGAATAAITLSQAVIEKLDDDERRRVAGKLRLVAEVAAKLALNMLKGVLKYERDDYSTELWVEYLIDDATDTLNYAYLLREAMQGRCPS